MLKTIAAKLASQIYHDHNLDFYDPYYDIEGGLYQVDDRVWLAWRGSDHILDWLVNFQLGQSLHEGVAVHSGFFLAYEKVRLSVELATDGIDDIWITGHSLGGAIGLLSAFHLARLGKKVFVYSFGCPKVGSQGFAVECDRYFTHHRYQNIFDLVCYFPLGENFVHGGIAKNLPKFYFNPHHIDNYQKCLAL